LKTKEEQLEEKRKAFQELELRLTIIKNQIERLNRYSQKVVGLDKQLRLGVLLFKCIDSARFTAIQYRIVESQPITTKTFPLGGTTINESREDVMKMMWQYESEEDRGIRELIYEAFKKK
jgi:hypothetical protein